MFYKDKNTIFFSTLEVGETWQKYFVELATDTDKLSKDNFNAFNEEGRILQVEYAIKNVSNAGTTLGLVCKDGIFLLGITTTMKNNMIQCI